MCIFKRRRSPVVAQYYDTDVNKEYAIRGNSAILKCVVPSFVADFVKVLSWHTDEGEEFVPGDDYGTIIEQFDRNKNVPMNSRSSFQRANRYAVAFLKRKNESFEPYRTSTQGRKRLSCRTLACVTFIDAY